MPMAQSDGYSELGERAAAMMSKKFGMDKADGEISSGLALIEESRECRQQLLRLLDIFVENFVPE